MTNGHMTATMSVASTFESLFSFSLLLLSLSSLLSPLSSLLSPLLASPLLLCGSYPLRSVINVKFLLDLTCAGYTTNGATNKRLIDESYCKILEKEINNREGDRYNLIFLIFLIFFCCCCFSLLM
jgi:hypothetical protein